MCANITKRFEQRVARDLWGDARISYDAPSRRKKDRKSHILLKDPEDPEARLKVPYSEYPAPMIFYTMGKAGALQGLPNSPDISSFWKLVSIVDEEKLRAFERKYPGKLTAQFRHVPDSFGRLLAKIGYGQALCLLDPSDFRPICLPYILGTEKNVSYVVGAATKNEPPMKSIGYSLTSAAFGNAQRLIVVSEVRLMAHNDAPTYHVVVGDVLGSEKVRNACDKLQSKGTINIQLDASLGSDPADVPWMPSVWPLPAWNAT